MQPRPPNPTCFTRPSSTNTGTVRSPFVSASTRERGAIGLDVIFGERDAAPLEIFAQLGSERTSGRAVELVHL